jgi:NADH-quinone oxidoreductase subunit G
MINLTIDDKAISVPKGTTVYHAAKQLGIDIPIFCYLDRMPPFGACRMCLVEVEKMGKLQTSCTLEATEGMIVKTQSKMAEEGRQDILEYLLLNHPLDCPVCDRGGECPLQDNTMKFGPGKSRFYEEKRRFKKPIPLGPVLMLDRERCIVCARCTRFCDNLSGDHALEFIDRGFKTEVGTPDGGTAESKFIGNTILICPVGALTSEVYRFRARPWDNKPTETTCTLCPVGCSMYFDQRDGEIMRTRSHENKKVNDIWLCDKGWFGYEFTYSADRLHSPMIRKGDYFEAIGWEEALNLIADKIKAAIPNGKIAGWGGNPLTFEENYFFQQLLREGAQVNHLDHRIGIPLFKADEEGLFPGMAMSIGDCEQLEFAYLLGLDLTEEFPVIWLRLRQAINKGAPVSFSGHFAPEISPYLSQIHLHSPGNELEILNKLIPEIAALISEGKKGAIFIGRQYLAGFNRAEILSELSKLQGIPLNIMEGNGNSMGARLAGMRPDVGPFNSPLDAEGLNALEVLEESQKNGWDVIYVAGADPAVKFREDLWKSARSKLGFLIVQDLFLTETALQADLILPTLSYAEKKGHFINIEGRIQKLLPGKEIPEMIYSDAEIFTLLANKLNFSLWIDEHMQNALEQEFLPLEKPLRTRLTASKTGIGAYSNTTPFKASFETILIDQGVRMRHNPHLIQLAREPKVRINRAEGQKRGIQSGDQISLSINGNVIFSKIKLDDNVAEGTAVLPLGFEKIPVQNLANNLLNGLPVEISKIENVQ